MFEPGEKTTTASRRRWIRFGSFFLPVCIMAIAFICRGIAPFGDKCLIGMDAYAQYFPMLYQRLTDPGTWSFHGALGFNQFAQGAYYTNSPLWILLYLFPKLAWPAAVDLIVLLRIGLSGLFFACFLYRKKVNDWLIPAFSSAYAVSGYVLAFANQFMWMDAVALLPLVALGVDMLCVEGRRLPYVLSLALTLYSNFYVGYMVCIFCVLYFAVWHASHDMAGKARLMTVLNFALCSLLSGGLVAFCLIPTAKALAATIASTLSFNGKFEWYHSLGETLKMLLPFQKISLEYGAPNLYFGLIATLLLLVFPFMCKKKVVKFVVFPLCVVFILASCNLNLLDFLWHGFHYPNQLPGRETFIFIFAGVAAAAYAASRLMEKNKLLPLMLACCLTVEIGANAAYTLVKYTWTAQVSSVRAHEEELDELRGSMDSEPFYRTELIPLYYHNFGQRYSFNGISYYSSTMSAAAFRFFRRIGGSVYAANVSTHYVPTRIQNAIFGVRYLIAYSSEDIKNLNKPLNVREVGRSGNAILYENTDCLPIAFVADRAVLDVDMGEEGDYVHLYCPTLLERTIWFSLLGRQTEEGAVVPAWEDTFSDDVKGLQAGGLQITSFRNDRIEGIVRCEEDGILFTSIPDDGGWHIRIDGEEVPVKQLLGYLCGAEISAGEHHVEMYYRTPGLRAGIAISVLSAAMLVFLCFMRRKKGMHAF